MSAEACFGLPLKRKSLTKRERIDGDRCSRSHALKIMQRTKNLRGECTECGRPLEFPAEIIGTTVPCPYCGKSTELMLAAPTEENSASRKAVTRTLIAILVLLLGLAASLIALKRAQNWAEKHKQQSPVAPTNQ
jgi:hypothetical protein